MINPMPPPHIGRVALAVADIERSIRFYTDVIGLTLLARDGDDAQMGAGDEPVSYTHLRAHETVLDLVCRLLLEKKKITQGTDTIAHSHSRQRPNVTYLDDKY